MSVMRCAPSCHVEFNATPLSGVPLMPAGFAILTALGVVARTWPTDIEITCGSEGKHSGPTDPHKRGEAIDVRTNNLTKEQKYQLVVDVIVQLRSGATDTVRMVGKTEVDGWCTDHFFACVESPGQPNEHAHFQVRRGTSYP